MADRISNILTALFRCTDGTNVVPLLNAKVMVDENGVAVGPYFASIGGVNRAIPYVLAQSASPVSGAADTAENTLATITVPANAMGPNGSLRIWTSWTFTNGADDKIIRARFSGAAGTIYTTNTLTTTLSTRTVFEISNRNATNSQVGSCSSSASAFGANSANALVTSTVDTTAATTIVITGQKETGGDTLTLERYLVEVLYGA